MELLTVWLENKSVGLFDSSISNKTERPLFESILCHDYFTLRSNEANNDFMKWLAIQKVCLKEFVLFASKTSVDLSVLNFSRVESVVVSDEDVEETYTVIFQAFVYIFNQCTRLTQLKVRRSLGIPQITWMTPSIITGKYRHLLLLPAISAKWKTTLLKHDKNAANTNNQN